MWTAYKDFWYRGTRFKGVSSRAKFWWTALMNILLGAVSLGLGMYLSFKGSIEQTQAQMSILSGGSMDSSSLKSAQIKIAIGIILIIAYVLYSLISLVPRYALMTRRFHDVGFSGWWVWIVEIFALAIGVGSLVERIYYINAMGSEPVGTVTIFVILSLIPMLFALVIEVLPTNHHKEPFRNHK